MTASITLLGVRITTAALYRQYFRYEEVFGILSTNRKLFRRFLSSVFPQLVPYDLFGPYYADGTFQSGAPVALLDAPEECLELRGWIFKPVQGAEYVTTDAENFVADILSRYRNYREDRPNCKW